MWRILSNTIENNYQYPKHSPIFLNFYQTIYIVTIFVKPDYKQKKGTCLHRRNLFVWKNMAWFFVKFFKYLSSYFFLEMFYSNPCFETHTCEIHISCVDFYLNTLEYSGLSLIQLSLIRTSPYFEQIHCYREKALINSHRLLPLIRTSIIRTSP